MENLNSMMVVEFINKVADGTCGDLDIIKYADQATDKTSLLWALYFADKGVVEATGKPQITDDRGVNRILNAIDLISSYFNVSMWDESVKQPQKIRLIKVCELLNDVSNNIEHPDEILSEVRAQIEKDGHLINGTGYIDYIKNNIYNCKALNTWGRGNPLLDEDRIGNIFELLDTLKFELSKVGCNRQSKVGSNEPQQENNDKTTGVNLPSEPIEEVKAARGRKSKSFAECVNGDATKRLCTLHQVMKGKIGREAALVIRKAIIMGWITKPTFTAVEEEFKDIGNKSGFNKYMSNKYIFTEEELQGVEAQLTM